MGCGAYCGIGGGGAYCGGAGIGGEDADHGAEVAVVECVAAALEVVEVGKDLLGPLDVAGGAFDLNAARAQVDVNVEAVF